MAKTIRVFISSTFQDMHEERDILVKEVFPKIRRRCRERNLRLVDVDLRWGIPEGKITDDTLVDICLEEIDNCEPFFICLVGNRYGTLAKVDEKWRQKLDLDKDNYSITELEIRHRLVKLYKEQRAGLLFYFRDTSSESLIEEDKKRLTELKKYICTKVPENIVSDYSHLYEMDSTNPTGKLSRTAFGEMVLEDLWKQIDAKYPQSEEELVDEFQQEQKFQERQLEYKASQFFGRDNLLHDLKNHIRLKSSNRPVFVTGKPGTGKSTLMAKVIKDFQNHKEFGFVLPVFVGLSQRTSTVKDIVHYISDVLKNTYKEIPTSQYYEDLHSLLWKLNDRKVTIFIDGIDQILDSNCRDLHMLLPTSLPQSVGLIVSAVSQSSQMKVIRNVFAEDQIFTIGKLAEADVQKLAEKILKLHGKEMVPLQMDALIQNNGASNPLFLNMLLCELRYFVPKKQGNYDNQVIEYINSLPGDLENFIQKILDRLEGDNNKEIVSKTLELISCSRKSLSEDEISEILKDIEGDYVPEFQWIISSLKEHLLTLSETQFQAQTVHVYHQSIKDGINKRYLHDKDELKKIHRYLADYHFKKFTKHHQYNSSSINEYLNEPLYHWTLAEEWEKIDNIIGNISYLEAQFGKTNIYGFIEDLYHLYEYQGTPDSIRNNVAELLLFVNREKDLLSKHPHLVLQQAINQCDVPYLSKNAQKQASETNGEKIVFELINKHHVNDQIRRKLSDSAEICNIFISPDGEKISALLQSGTWKMWKVKTGQQEINRKIKLESNSRCTAHAVLFKSGKAVFGTNQGEIYELDIESGIMMKNQVFTKFSHAVKFIAISQDEQLLSIYYENGVIKIWDYHDKKILQKYQLHYPAHSMKFDNQGGYAWLLCEQGNIIRLGVVNEEIEAIEPYREGESVSFYDYDPVSEEGIYTQNHEAYLLAKQRYERLEYPDREKKHISACAIDPCIDKAAIVVHNNIHIFHQYDKEKRQDLYNVATNISDIRFIPNSSQLLCIESNRVIQLIDYEHSNDNKDAVYQKETIFKCEYLDEGNKLLTVCKDGTVKIWDLELGTTLKLYKEFLGSHILDSIVTPDGNTLILLGQKNQVYTVSIFELGNLYKDGNEIEIIKKKMEEVEVLFRIQEKYLNYAAISPNGQYYVIQDRFGVVKIINLHKLRAEKGFVSDSLFLKEDQMTSVDFDESGLHVMFSFSDGTIVVYDIRLLEEVFRIQTSLLIRRIRALANEEGFVCLCDKDVILLGPDFPQKNLSKHDYSILDMDYYMSTEGRLSVASLSKGGVLKVYHEGGTIIHQVWKDAVHTKEDMDNITKCSFLTEEKILTTSYDEMVRIWELCREKNSIRLLGEYFIPGACYSFAMDEQGRLALTDKQGKVHFIKEFDEKSVDLVKMLK